MAKPWRTIERCKLKMFCKCSCVVLFFSRTLSRGKSPKYQYDTILRQPP